MYYTVFDPEWEKYGRLQQTVERAEKCTEFKESLKNKGIVRAYLGSNAVLLVTDTGERVLVDKATHYFAQVCFLRKYGHLMDNLELIKDIKSLLNA